MWTMHDAPGLQTKGKHGCSICTENLDSKWSYWLGKTIYPYHRKYLPLNYPLRAGDLEAFNNEPETRPIPERPKDEYWLEQEQKIKDGVLRREESGMNRLSIFYELPYWKDLLIPHLLDPMHLEKNITSNLLKTLANSTGTRHDSLGLRFEMEEVKRMKAHWRQPFAPANGKMGHVRFLANKSGNQFDISYSRLGLQQVLVHPCIHSFITHDFHIILHYMLPVAVRGKLHRGLRAAIYRLSEVFRWVCRKQIKTAEIPDMKVKAAEAMCLLEMYFPANFFDMQPHNVVHVVEEVELADPVHSRWLYLMERYMKYLKSMVRQLAHPEGSVAEGYLAREAMFYSSAYLSALHPSATSIYKDVSDPRESGELVLPKRYRERRLSDEEGVEVQDYVLKNTPAMLEWEARWIEQRQEARRTQTRSARRRGRGRRGRRGSRTVDFPKFADWIRNEVPRLLDLGTSVLPEVEEISRGPDWYVKSYSHCWSKGHHFRVKRVDEKRKTTQDSGLAAAYTQGSVARSGDPNEVRSDLDYYGKLEDIMEVSYGDHYKRLLFKGDWYQTNLVGPDRTHELDECRFVRVRKVPFGGARKEPFIDPDEAEQVFYVDDTENENSVLVAHGKARGKVAYVGGEEVPDDDIHDLVLSDNEILGEGSTVEFVTIPIRSSRRRNPNVVRPEGSAPRVDPAFEEEEDVIVLIDAVNNTSIVSDDEEQEDLRCDDRELAVDEEV